VDLAWLAAAASPRADAAAVQAVGDREADFQAFDSLSRLGRVRTALRHVVGDNAQSARFGLVPMRQQGVRIDTSEWVTIATDAPAATAPTDTGVVGTWRAGVPRAGGLGATAGAAAALVAADQAGANALLVSLLGLAPATAGGLLPGGADSASAIDAPIGLLLDDLRAEATRLVSTDSACCNTVAVLVTGGGDPGLGSDELGEKASAFLAIGGRRVPVYVIALAPTAAEAVQLQKVAQRSGGRYIEIAAAAVDAVPATDFVPEIAAAFNLAVQHAFANFADINVAPSASLPTGPLVK
jgi:hypothetical protein